MSDERQHTLDEKRAFAREHLVSMVGEARAYEAHYRAAAESRATFAAYCDRRASNIEQTDEVELDLMIAQWRAEARTETTRQATYGTGYEQVRLLRKYDAPPSPPVPVFAAVEGGEKTDL